MKKRKKGAILRKGGPALPVVRGIVEALVLWGRVETNWSWAKAVQGQVDRLVGWMGRGVAGERMVAGFLMNKREVVKRLKEVVLPQLEGRKSGLTRVRRLAERRGDGTVVGRLEWVVEIKEPEEKVEKKRKETKGDQGEEKKK